MSTVINYLILYKDTAAAAEIDLSKIDVSGNAYDLKIFKESLKNLLADNKSENIISFLGELVKIAQTQNTLATATATAATFNDVNPFIFAIDTIINDNIKRTYLTFTGTISANDLKVNFNQYSVDATIFTDIEKFFNDKLITMKYSGYTALTTATATITT